MPEIIVAASPRFEICYALAGRVGGMADHREPVPRWLALARELGEPFWVAVPDALSNTDSAPEASAEEFFSALDAVSEQAFFEEVARGLFHEENTKASRREWLAYIGAENRQGVVSNWRKIAGPSLRQTCVRILRDFWRTEFEAVWGAIVPQLHASAARTERLASACSLAELAGQLLLRAEFDEEAGLLKALRGGFTLPVGEIGKIVLLPSAFNTRRLWHSTLSSRPATVFFPYFDPGISVESQTAPASEEFDPWLICRALGDPTRNAIIRRLARGEAAAGDLVAQLDLSKGNISHHLFHLREAGLITEEREGRTVRLRLRADRFRMLSDQLVRALELDKGDLP